MDRSPRQFTGVCLHALALGMYPYRPTPFLDSEITTFPILASLKSGPILSSYNCCSLDSGGDVAAITEHGPSLWLRWEA